MKIAVMQPYWHPYAGYFRLFAATDLFVFLDDIQFNRRGRVHRFDNNDRRWTTLPIKKTDRDTTRIMDLQWQKGKEKDLPPVDYIIGVVGEACRLLGLHFNCARSSGMGIMLAGQDKIIAVCNKLGATEYVNLPGGRDLYDEESFARENIKLTFLPDYRGSYKSVANRFGREDPDDIRKEIYDNL